jgi:hypothetical protein
VKPIRPYSAAALVSVIFFALVPSLCAQEATAPRHTGVPQDWSQHHIVFSRDALARDPDLINREPRIRYQAMQRWQVPNFAVFQGADPLRVPAPPSKSSLHRDWDVNLAGHIAPGTFPAKYSFDPDAPPDCLNDYVVFGLATTETAGLAGTNANLVGFNNLYSTQPTAGGLCDTDGPSVLFAYNITTVTGGRILTSPVLSEDGSQIAFIESIPASAGIAAQAIFHVLTWAANPIDSRGALGAAVLPVSMTSVPFSSTANDTTSSPWVDYGADTAYVGTDNGEVWQIVGVFKSASALGGPPWPITLNSGFRVGSPVLDGNQRLLVIGNYNGALYQINIDSPGTSPSAMLQIGFTDGTTPGIVAPPIVDITNGTTFVVSAYSTFAFGDEPFLGAALVQVDTASLAPLQEVNLGEGSTGTPHPSPVVHLYEPAFSNEYYTDPTNASALISLCGTGAADTSPYQYTFGFTVTPPSTQPIMNASPNTGFPLQLSTSTTDRCSGWTEFYNPTIGDGVDFFFFGLTGDCTSALLGGSLGPTGGCVVAFSNDPLIPTATAAVNGGTSGIIVDNYSSAAEASSIYFTAETQQTVYKFTQNGLH